MKQISFGKYTLHHRLTRGGMAELFLARSAEFGGGEELVVIKLLLGRYSDDETFLSMFRDEARIATTLRHPNIGRVFDVGEVEGQYYIAMEYIHGRDLCATLQRSLRQGGPLPVSFAVLVAIRVCAALHYAHQARDEARRPLQIVHRDVSLSNVMITFSGQVKLVDFGIAKAANRCSLTLPGMLKGKARYMSPEQITGQELDHRSDLFTLGTTLWEATCGRHLFDHKEEMLVYEAVAKGWVNRPSEVVKGYPSELERILLRALAREPADRYPDAQAMQQELEAFARASGLQISDLALSRTMHQLFPEEVSAWQQAVVQRKTLLQYVTEVVDVEAHAHDLEEVLDAGDKHTTGLAGSPPLAQLPLAPDKTEASAPPAVLHEPPAAQPGQRKTLLYGQAPVTPAVQSPPAGNPAPAPAAGHPAAAEQGQHYRLAEQGQLALSPEGTVLDQLALRSADDRRPTIMADSGRPPEQAPGRQQTLIDDAATTLAPDPDLTLPSLSDKPPPRPAPEPVIASDRLSLSKKLASMAEGNEGHGESYKEEFLTGDWGHQAASQGEKRAGTHPYFGLLREMAKTFRPVAPDEELSPERVQRRLLLRLILIATLVALLALAGLLWIMLRGEEPTTAAVQSDSAAGPAMRRTSTPASAPETPADPATQPRLESVPSGASVFDAESGEELGQTPLAVDLQDRAQRRVIVRLAGHRGQTVTLGQSPSQTITLEAEKDAGEQAAEAKRTPQGSAAGSRPRPTKKRFRPTPTEDTLIDPFE